VIARSEAQKSHSWTPQLMSKPKPTDVNKPPVSWLVAAEHDGQRGSPGVGRVASLTTCK